ncbi:uncharacterized protein [Rhodnius prolixus]|uniref:uncharacterized protein n=1 Tax=Rhodnius prolixus TaxID=13249 RepID=UPI003D18F468
MQLNYSFQNNKISKTNLTHVNQTSKVKAILLAGGRKKAVLWFGHVLRMSDTRLPKKALSWQPAGRQRRGRPMNSWLAQVKELMIARGLCESDAQNREGWMLGARNLWLGKHLERRRRSF